MEMVKINPELSPFQEALLYGLREEVLGEGDLERLRREGADLTRLTAERFYRATAREESYRYAVRLLDSLLSFYLTANESAAARELKQTSLSALVKKSVEKLRMFNQLPTTSILPLTAADIDIMDMLVERARKLQSTTRSVLLALNREINARKTNKSTISLAEFFIGRVGGKLRDFEFESSADICHAEFMSIIFNLTVGPYLTLAILKKIARRKRPSLEEVAARLQAHESLLPLAVQADYRVVMKEFLTMKNTDEFFGAHEDISVFSNDLGGLYFAERSARVFDDEPE